MRTIFFSWQADTETKIGRNLVERALSAAIDRIGADADVHPVERDVLLDKDTQGVAGSPPIVETIFGKIDKASVFVPDLTFVGTRRDGRPTPNPNVLIEYGWALNTLRHSRMVPIMNAAFGEPARETMPFDMAHLRFPITYNCPPDADDARRKSERDALSKKLETALRAVLSLGEVNPPPKPNLFVPRVAVDGLGRPYAKDRPVGIVTLLVSEKTQPLKLADAPLMWLRVMPKYDPGKKWALSDVQKLAKTPGHIVETLNTRWAGYGSFRNSDAYGVYPAMSSFDKPILAALMLFNTGEVWSVDAYHIEAAGRGDTPTVPLQESDWMSSLNAYASFLQALGVEGPYRWIAGMEGIKGRSVFLPHGKGYSSFYDGPRGQCFEDFVIEDGEFNVGEAPAEALLPFFNRLYEACGVSRTE
jgi:hypothetical protein